MDNSEKNNEKLSENKKTIIYNKYIHLIALLVLISFPTLIFGFVGLKSVLIFIIIFSLPVYSIIKKLNLDIIEKAIFSLFLGLGLFPLAVFYINRIIPSFRISTIVIFMIILLIGFVINYHKGKG